MLNFKDLKEYASHGNALVPMHIYDCYFEFGDLVVPYHWHDEIEIIYVTKGSIGITINSKDFILNEGNLIFINSGDLHQINRVTNESSLHHALVFSPNMLSFDCNDSCQISFIKPLIEQTLKFSQSIDIKSDYGLKIIDLFSEIIEEYKYKYEGWYLNIKSCLYKILSIFARNDLLLSIDNNLRNISYKEELIKNALEYIHHNYEEKIYISDIASTIGLNTEYFCRFFKISIGQTPIEYINRYRINMACELFRNEDISVLDTCFKVGFENQSYFIKLFKKYNNLTPLQYKKFFY